MKTPELILPAGNFDKLKFAIAFGADAVYAGVPLFSLRARENQFTIDSVREAVFYAHEKKKRIYLTCNIFAHNRKIEPFLRAMSEMVALKPDAFIMADIGLITLAKEKWPDIEIHLSTQANTTNWAQVKFWKSLGINHVVLARELSLDEIKGIKDAVPDVSLETFVHGAMCFSYSGRCMISNYLTGRDSNQGMCPQACRWQYKIFKGKSLPEQKNYQPLQDQYYVEETERPGELMRVDEDENGTYLFNSRDLCALPYLRELMDAGVTHFKIEGRSKTAYYAATAARCYRKAIDCILAGKEVPAEELVAELATAGNRGFTPGFLLGSLGGGNQDYEKNTSYRTADFLGIIRSYDPKTQLAEVEVKNRFQQGDIIELITPEKTVSEPLTTIVSLEGEPLTEAHGGDKNVKIRLAHKPDECTLIRRSMRDLH